MDMTSLSTLLNSDIRITFRLVPGGPLHTKAIQTDAEFYLFHKTAKDREKTVLGRLTKFIQFIKFGKTEDKYFLCYKI